MTDLDVLVTLGVDTHTDTHVAAALDQFGRLLGTYQLAATTAGFAALLGWVDSLGVLERTGVEGSGSHGAGLARWLRSQGLVVIEVDRPDRKTRRYRGKSDPLDAESAARAVQAGTATAQPKAGDGHVEMIRTLRVARRSAIKARTQAANQLRALVVTAPDDLRAELRGLALPKLVSTCARYRPGAVTTVTTATKTSLKSIAGRYRRLSDEITALDADLARLVGEAAPALLAAPCVGPEIAAAILVAAGDNPDRLRTEAAFAHLCGVAPVPASSGKTDRHRLNRAGNRDANSALYMLAIGRMGRDDRTRAYVARRTAEGKHKAEIIRCLKRYLARELYQTLYSQPGSTAVTSTT